jgi:hypothetical protein
LIDRHRLVGAYEYLTSVFVMALNAYNLLVVYLVTFGSLTYGYNSAIIGAVIGLPSFFDYFKIDIKSDGGSQITGGEFGPLL